MNRKTMLVLVAVLALLLSGVAWAEPVRLAVDPFTAPQCAALDAGLCPGGAPAANTQDAADILGGERDVQLAVASGPGMVSLRVPGDGRLLYSNGPLDRSTAAIVWDGDDGDPQALGFGLGLDLAGGCPGGWRLVLQQAYLDQGVTYSLGLYTDAAHYSTWSSGPVTGSGEHSARAWHVGPDDLAPAGSLGGVDLAYVGAIVLQADASTVAATDLALVETHLVCETSPTAVFLSSLAARTLAGDSIQLTWETAAEVRTLGFHLYRASAWDRSLFRVNGALIPSQSPGGLQGAVYTFTDPYPAQVPGCYYYWLEDVDVNGLTTLHGPILGGNLCRGLGQPPSLGDGPGNGRIIGTQP